MLVKNLRQKMAYGLTVQYFLDRLSEVGISIRPFYIVEEGCRPIENETLSTPIQPCTPCFLSRDEIRLLAAHPECGHSEQVFMDRFSDGCQCFGLKHHSELMAYMWCNLKNCTSYITYPLKTGEAYLFDAWTYKKFRGKNLAPILRDHLYKNLSDTGFHRFYSVSDSFNTPALKFKKKLGAKNIKLFLHIKLLKKYKTAFLIKTIN